MKHGPDPDDKALDVLADWTVRSEEAQEAIENTSWGKSMVKFESAIDRARARRAAQTSPTPPSVLTAAAPAIKEPERITLPEGLRLLVNRLPIEEAKERLRHAFISKAFSQEPCFAFPYDEAEIDWTTGAVKIPRKPDRFFPTFLGADFNAYFFEDRMPSQPTYARQTILTAADMLKALGHSGFDRFLLELDLPDKSAGIGNGLMARATSLAKFAIDNPAQLTPERRTVAYEIVSRAAQLWRDEVTSNLSAGEREKFESAMHREGQAQMLAVEQTDHALWRLEMGNSGSSYLTPTSPLNPATSPLAGRTDANPLSRKVFVVHGHDEAALHEVARFLEKLELEAIVLREQPDQGRTVIEKFDDCAKEVGFAVVLMTPDDIAGAAATPSHTSRARQNVIFRSYVAAATGSLYWRCS